MSKEIQLQLLEYLNQNLSKEMKMALAGAGDSGMQELLDVVINWVEQRGDVAHDFSNFMDDLKKL